MLTTRTGYHTTEETQRSRIKLIDYKLLDTNARNY